MYLPQSGDKCLENKTLERLAVCFRPLNQQAVAVNVTRDGRINILYIQNVKHDVGRNTSQTVNITGAVVEYAGAH